MAKWPAPACAPFLRYAVVAGACLLLHNLIMIAADRIGLTVWQAACVAFCLMVVVGYLLLIAFVFDERHSWDGFLRYTLAMAANFPLVTALTWLLVDPLGRPMAIAAPAASCTMVLINFFASRWAILGRRSSPSTAA